MENFIDIGIDFGAENIVTVAVGYDKLGRSDLRLINLDGNISIKNYIAQNKNSNNIEIGSEVKSYYIHKEYIHDYSWISGRYKSYILEEEKPYFPILPEKLFEYGIKKIIEKIKKFDFSILLSGALRNLCVGIPQSWNIDKKKLYYETLFNLWDFGEVYILSEPIAATIAVYKKSLKDIANKNIMILDIGASTFDISFSKYNDKNKKLDIYNINYRSNYAGHFFDVVFTAFTIFDSINKNAIYDIIDRVTKLKLKTISDYISYIKLNQDKFSILLLEIENIKENYISEIVKFNRKRVIDINLKNTFIVNKQIYENALKYYVSLIYSDIEKVLNIFCKVNNKDSIIPVLCGGASALYGLEKELKSRFNELDLISISKENSNSKIDSTIAIGLAYYSQDKNLIEKNLNYTIDIILKNDENIEEKINVFQKNEKYSKSKSLLKILNDEVELEYNNISDGSINIKILKNDIEEKIIKFKNDNFSLGDKFDLELEIDINDMLILKLKNLSKQITITQIL
ncbi:MAG: hypothetical protein KatS3mg068_0714 [Candidatus Sericytochromatia bacterium]|nr:MAG: hypothetical protein KatS3mg068_0714 [Candidatus Sericytochromatia bacterium]